MINYPLKSSDNKLTYGIGVNQGKNKSEFKIIIQFTNLNDQEQVRIAFNREEIREFVNKLNDYCS